MIRLARSAGRFGALAVIAMIGVGGCLDEASPNEPAAVDSDDYFSEREEDSVIDACLGAEVPGVNRDRCETFYGSVMLRVAPLGCSVEEARHLIVGLAQGRQNDAIADVDCDQDRNG